MSDQNENNEGDDSRDFDFPKEVFLPESDPASRLADAEAEFLRKCLQDDSGDAVTSIDDVFMDRLLRVRAEQNNGTIRKRLLALVRPAEPSATLRRLESRPEIRAHEKGDGNEEKKTGRFRRRRTVICAVLWATLILLVLNSSVFMSDPVFHHAFGETRPLAPCTIHLTQEGIPLSGASVALHPVEGGASWSCGGLSDENGYVTILTNGQFTGVPCGEYKVTVSKVVLETKSDENSDRSGKYLSIHGIRTVDSNLFLSETTPLGCQVDTGENMFSFDLGKPEATPLEIDRIMLSPEFADADFDCFFHKNGKRSTVFERFVFGCMGIGVP